VRRGHLAAVPVSGPARGSRRRLRPPASAWHSAAQP
jgi:hypothetical protein